MKKPLFLNLIPILLNITLLIFGIVGRNNNMFNILWENNHTYIFYTQNIFYYVFMYPICYIILYHCIFKEFFNKTILNVLLSPKNRYIYFYKNLVFSLIHLLLVNIVNVLFSLLSYYILYNNTNVASVLIENTIYSFYSQVVMMIFICTLCFNKGKNNLLFVTIITMFVSNLMTFTLTNNEQVWAFLPNVMIQALSLVVELSLTITNLSLLLNFMYITILLLILGKIIKNTEL